MFPACLNINEEFGSATYTVMYETALFSCFMFVHSLGPHSTSSSVWSTAAPTALLSGDSISTLCYGKHHPPIRPIVKGPDAFQPQKPNGMDGERGSGWLQQKNNQTGHANEACMEIWEFSSDRQTFMENRRDQTKPGPGICAIVSLMNESSLPLFRGFRSVEMKRRGRRFGWT